MDPNLDIFVGSLNCWDFLINFYYGTTYVILRVTNIPDKCIFWMAKNRIKISAGHVCCRDHMTLRVKILNGKHDYWGINYLGREEKGCVNVASTPTKLVVGCC